MITKAMIGTKISITMMGGDRRQGKLISINDEARTFSIHWKKDKEDDFFFRTVLNLDRIESITETVHPPKTEIRVRSSEGMDTEQITMADGSTAN